MMDMMDMMSVTSVRCEKSRVDSFSPLRDKDVSNVIAPFPANGDARISSRCCLMLLNATFRLIRLAEDGDSDPESQSPGGGCIIPRS